ncbi:MAG TPA: hypothetical protein VFQ53_12875 [Kofleriaceae bacterium]|nr:hypothetical protein [Kofleriaceae bacterium]
MLETLMRRLDMVRLTIAASALLVMVGCSGLIDGGGSGGLTPQQAEARRLWLEKALPQIAANCVVCHDGSRANIGFVEGTSDLGRRDTLMAYEPAVVNLDAPGSSRILTKGLHEGPALDATQTSDILEWIQAEKEAAGSVDGGGETVIKTDQFLVQVCTGGLPDTPAAPNPNCLFNNVPLDGIGATGAKITFIVQALGSGLYMTNLKLVPGAAGAFIEHPLFVAYPADGSAPKADTIDRFFSVKMNLQSTATAEEQQIAGGAAAFVGFFPTDKLEIHFKAANVFQPDDGGGGTVNNGCKDLASFKANAQGPVNTNCRSCHGGANPNATSAMNVTGIDTADDTMIQNACNQVRTRVNFQDIAQSSIYLATQPGNNNHPFTFGGNQGAHDAFKASVDVWINAEKVAP